MKRADRVVELAWSLAHRSVTATRRIYSATDRSIVLEHDPTSMPLPPTAHELGTIVLQLLSRHNESPLSVKQLKEQRPDTADPVIELHRSDSDAFFVRGHWMCVSRGQPARSPISLGATITSEIDFGVQVLDGNTTAVALGDAILQLWERIVAARGLA